MSDLVTAVFPDKDTALRARDELVALAEQGHLSLTDAIVVERGNDGETKTYPLHAHGSGRVAKGALIGGLLGLAALGPVLGLGLAAAGLGAAGLGAAGIGAGMTAVAGGALGAVSETVDGAVDAARVGKGDARSVAEKLQPGSAALISLVVDFGQDRAKTEEVVQRLIPYGGRVVRTSLPQEQEEQILRLIDEFTPGSGDEAR
ncbi:DUF1269 domain-containing protein [Nonomuraea typhae]|uniref:DUF1269 domain-containing protein n=1 Tax=Nonomuraea typhae TaxID=2603600 RepID=A0ABW7ZA98_9ACTN